MASILVVDDNPLNRKLTRLVLELEGFEVQTVASVADALSEIEARRPSLVLMDLQLPEADGLELTRTLKADRETRDIPIIALTAHAMKGDEERARSAGCDAYVTKPIDTRALPGLVRRALGWGDERPGR